jgi:nucleotide-binding universal stress UspA family protein
MISSVPQIVIPIDFSEQSIIALDQSYNLAKFNKAELSLVYVIDDKHESVDEAAMKAKLEELAETAGKKHNIKVNAIVIKGPVSDKILEVAGSLKTKMIIMGTNGSKGLKEGGAAGSNSLKVVEKANFPVVTIKGKSMREGCKNIVLPIDLTKESLQKVKKAIELGKLYGATIRMISVSFSQDKSTLNRLIRKIEEATFLIKSEVNCTSEIVNAVEGRDSLAQIVLDYSNKVQADLIMIMTQQEEDLKLVPIAATSDAHYIISNSDVPVMSIVPSLKLHQVKD